MKLWPFNRATEKRQESSYTDTLVTLLVNQAGGKIQGNPNATAAVEAGAGMVARSFASATVQGGPPMIASALTPDCLALIGRALIREGEICLAIDVDGDMVKLWPAADYDVFGTYDPMAWTYRLNLAGPSRWMTRWPVSADGVCHFRYLVDPERPWRGIGPIESAALAGKLSAETTKALADESTGPRGSVMPMPSKDGNDPTLTQLKADLKALGGRMSLVESMSAGWGTEDARPGAQDWKQQRVGAEPPAALVDLNEQASREVLMAIGLSPVLFESKPGSAAAREAWRQALHAVITPLGKIIQREIQAKLHPDITLNFDNLMASDLMGRARAFQSMVNGGMDTDRAASLSGLMTPED